jgi:hypothetical protein
MSGEYASVGTQSSGVSDRAYAPPQAGLIFMPASPFLGLALFALDVLIVYGLVVHGGRREGFS